MKIEILAQHAGNQVGARVTQLLHDAVAGKFHEIVLVSAFAKRAGVSRISSNLAAAKAAGCKITGIIGIDHGGTSVEGFDDICSTCGEVFVVHSTNQQVTFHSKAYLFVGKSNAAIIVGSSNLTAGGLYTNIETCVEIGFDLPVDAAELKLATAWISPLRDTTLPYVVKVRSANKSVIRGHLPAEKFVPSASVALSGGSASKPNIFGSGSFPSPPKIKTSSVPSKASAQGQQKSAAQTKPPAQPASPAVTVTKRVWKKLSSFDASRKQAPGSIIVPKRFWSLFPHFNSSQTTPAGVVQPEVTFIGRHVDGPSVAIGDRRLIEYPPAATHARSNTERRLAFHDRHINPGNLVAGDVLIFEFLKNDPQGAVLNTIRWKPSHPNYAKLPGITKARGAMGELP